MVIVDMVRDELKVTLADLVAKPGRTGTLRKPELNTEFLSRDRVPHFDVLPAFIAYLHILV